MNVELKLKYTDGIYKLKNCNIGFYRNQANLFKQENRGTRKTLDTSRQADTGKDGRDKQTGRDMKDRHRKQRETEVNKQRWTSKERKHRNYHVFIFVNNIISYFISLNPLQN